jgi:hypothetical protein
MVNLEPKIWGPHYWFVLFSISLCYPKSPNNTAKKKFYHFIQNIPIFLPHDEISSKFAYYLDKYPVTPYLDSKDHLIRWVHFIHNIINKSLGKPTITLEEALEKYYYHYKPQEEQKKSALLFIKKYVYAFIIMFLIILLIILYQY